MSATTRIKPEVVDLALAAAEYEEEKNERAEVGGAKPTVEEIKAADWALRALDMTSSTGFEPQVRSLLADYLERYPEAA